MSDHEQDERDKQEAREEGYRRSNSNALASIADSLISIDKSLAAIAAAIISIPVVSLAVSQKIFLGKAIPQ